MFKSIRGINYFTPVKSPEDYIYQYKYRIVDSEFIEEWIGPSKQRLDRTEVRCGAIILCYESKNQNVAFNLALYHRYMTDTYHWYVLENGIKYNIEHTPNYYKYVDSVQNYLNKYEKLKILL